MKDFCRAYPVSELHPKLTEADAYRGAHPTLAQVEAAYTAPEDDWLDDALMELWSYYEGSKASTAPDREVDRVIDRLASDLRRLYSTLKVTEFELFFSRLRSGTYGEAGTMFGRLDASKVMQCMRQFNGNKRADLHQLEERGRQEASDRMFETYRSEMARYEHRLKALAEASARPDMVEPTLKRYKELLPYSTFYCHLMLCSYPDEAFDRVAIDIITRVHPLSADQRFQKGQLSVDDMQELRRMRRKVAADYGVDMAEADFDIVDPVR